MVKPIGSYNIVPALPPKLAHLRDLAYNLQWTWERDAVDLFRRLSDELWEDTGHNPVRMLGLISQEQLEALAKDESFLAHLHRVWGSLEHYLQRNNLWYHELSPDKPHPKTAYFSMEFGLTEALPIYSGGLGVLSGDHLKAASELGVDVVGVGLLYQQGYFRQRINHDGWQEELYPLNDFSSLPVQPERTPDGTPQKITVTLPGREVAARLWRVTVGRIPLILLDTNVPENRPEDQAITHRLYNGDLDMRIRQEIMLGIGGLRALHQLGMQVDICHLNEGHSAFLLLERIRTLMAERKLSFAAAREVVTLSSIFTAHTVVPAGIDRFPRQMIEQYFGAYCSEVGIDMDELMALGSEQTGDPNAPFSPTMLALRLAARINGVSRVHGVVSRQLFQGIWPEVPAHEVPITTITNGVHQLSFISRDMAELYERYLGPRWRERPGDQTVWEGSESIPPEELWRTHERRRERLVAFARRRLHAQLQRHGANHSELEAAFDALDPEALTIGFGRRFATYKRATLLLKDKERLARLLNQPDRPVQIIFAGKAHPADEPAKHLIQEIIQTGRQEQFRNHIVFLEDYDITVARYMVQGADVWLNTPRCPMEASGTSGMKAAANGALNVSTLDGWWAEAYRPEVGWGIACRGSDAQQDVGRQDYLEAMALYNLLEEEVIPLFYDRGRDGTPRRWVERMKASIRELCPVFNTNRMLAEYVTRFYMPAGVQVERLLGDDAQGARDLGDWVERVRAQWPQVRFESVDVDAPVELKVGENMPIVARLRLGQLKPEDVRVSAYYGRVGVDGDIGPETADMLTLESRGEAEPGVFEFAGTIPARTSGAGGYTVCVLPRHPELVSPYDLHLIRWA